MTSVITYDPRSAGSGKTLNYIYPLINLIDARDDYLILVLPSIKLQEAYKKAIPKLHIINSDSDNDVKQSVQSKLAHAIRSNYKMICITSECFTKIGKLNIHRNKYNLIIDEVLSPYSVEWINDEAWKTSLVCGEDEYTPSKEFYIFKELDISIVKEWKTVHIAAAAFEFTFMHFWLKSNDCKMRRLFDFERITGPIIHCANIKGKWSKEKQKKSESVDYLKLFREFAHASGINTIWMGNNINQMNHLTETDIRAPHNNAGINDMAHCNRVVIESALNTSDKELIWLMDTFKMSKQEVHCARSTYQFYQTIMRSSLRFDKDSIVDFYTLSKIDSIILKDLFFLSAEIDFFDLDIPVKKRKPRSDAGKKRVSTTQVERNRKYLAKKKLQNK
jgi:hypothetical protein